MQPAACSRHDSVSRMQPHAAACRRHAPARAASTGVACTRERRGRRRRPPESRARWAPAPWSGVASIGVACTPGTMDGGCRAAGSAGPGVSAVDVRSGRRPSESRARGKANAFLPGALGTVAQRGPTARRRRPTDPRAVQRPWAFGTVAPRGPTAPASPTNSSAPRPRVGDGVSHSGGDPARVRQGQVVGATGVSGRGRQGVGAGDGTTGP